MVNLRNDRGFGVLEIIIGISILSLSFFTLLTVAANMTRLSADVTRSLQANFLVEEGIEAMRSIRDSGWLANFSTLSGSTSLAFASSTPSWNTTTTPEIIGGAFTREVYVSSVARDINNDIVISGGTNDLNTKKVTVSVSWQGSTGTSTRSFATYLTNYFND